jgi:hypothetical protein
MKLWLAAVGVSLGYPAVVIWLFRERPVSEPGLVAGLGFLFLTLFLITLSANKNPTKFKFTLASGVLFLFVFVVPILGMYFRYLLLDWPPFAQQSLFAIPSGIFHYYSSKMYTVMILAVIVETIVVYNFNRKQQKTS